MLQHNVLLFTVIIITLVLPDVLTGTVIRIYNSTAEVKDHVPRGSTVVLVCICTETPTPQQVNYQWTCPNPLCDGQYRKVYGNVLVVVATPATSGQYSCSPTPGSGTAKRILDVQGSLVGDQLNIYNNERRLLPNTVVTSPTEIPNGLTCTKRSGSSYVPRFKRESDNTLVGTRYRSGHPATVQATDLQPNGGYRCHSDDGIQTRVFIDYYDGNATLPTPKVSVGSTTTDQQLHLLLTTPPPYNSGRFILRYDCTLGGADIEVEYRSVDPVVNSDTVVTRRSTSCFKVGDISRVTVWFVNGQKISTTPAVVIRANIAESTTAATMATTRTPATPVTPATSSIVANATVSSATSSTSTISTNLSSTETKTTVTTRSDTLDQNNSVSVPSSTPSTPGGSHSMGNNSRHAIDYSTLVPYIGSGAGSLLLVLVAVLAVIICCVVAMHRRGKRSRSTEHTPTLHYYSTPGHEQEEEPQVQIGADSYDTVVEKTASFTLGTLYDEIEVKPVKSKPVAVPSEYQLPLVEAIKEDDKENHNTVTIPESFYAQPDTTAKSNKKGEKGTTADVEDPDVLYAEVDKPKKKKKKGKEKKEEQPQGDLYAVVDKTSKKKGKGKKTKEKEQQGDEDLYAEVDKTKKKGKKCQKDKESNSFREAAVELDSPPPVPDRGLIYEPSADREASDQEQHHHQQQLQQQQQQEPEQQQQQLQKQEHEEGVEKQELQEQENTGPGKPSLN